MPTYEYVCKSCGYDFDAFQSMMDEPLKTCPKCGKEIRRLINGGNGVIFKGSGFYVTDNHHSGAADPKSAEASKDSSKIGSEKTGSEKSGSEKSAGAGSSACASCPANNAAKGEAPACPKASGQ